MCANFELETHLQALQNTVVSISEVYIPIEHRIKINSTKNQITSKKKLGQLDEKTAKNGYVYVPFSQKLLSKSKSHSLNAAHDRKTSFAQKKLVHAAILLLFAFRSKQRLNE